MITATAPIDPSPPGTWQQLQVRVARIYRECGWQVGIEQDVTSVRGVVNIDVVAKDPRPVPPVKALCECKHWRKAVPKTVIHSLRTVVSDIGANWGVIVSSKGFQKGAEIAAAHSNIVLLDWGGFEDLMKNQWITAYMVPEISRASNPLIEYTEPINSRVFRKADKLSKAKQAQFRQLRTKYQPLAMMLLPLQHPALFGRPIELKLPLNASLEGQPGPDGAVPTAVLAARSLRRLLLTYRGAVRSAAREFDEIFGERA